MMYKNLLWIAMGLILIAAPGCDVKEGDITNDIPLPTDAVLTLRCENVGISPETCILDDPDNPFAMANITEKNRWDLYADCPSAKSKFYLWATVLAKSPSGENQYYTARALHELYTEGGSVNAREQAKKAYRATLDNYFDSVTWYEAWWLGKDIVYAVSLKNMIGTSLYDPSDMNLRPLYDNSDLALVDLSAWGYIYDADNKILTKINQ